MNNYEKIIDSLLISSIEDFLTDSHNSELVSYLNHLVSSLPWFYILPIKSILLSINILPFFIKGRKLIDLSNNDKHIMINETFSWFPGLQSLLKLLRTFSFIYIYENPAIKTNHINMNEKI